MSDEVKIYSGCTASQNAELNAVLEAMQEHRRNGNIFKAKKLGKRLVDLEISFETGLDKRLAAPDVLYQMKVMLIFAAELSVQGLLSDQMLTTTVINAMYDEIQLRDSSFYESFSAGAAFSFYYLSIKDSEDVAKGVGETFAMLCGAEGDTLLCQAGKDAYERAVMMIADELEKVKFKVVDFK